MQKTIIVNPAAREGWESAWDQKEKEMYFEKQGETHLLSHNIWSAKFNMTGARTDLVLIDPTYEIAIDPTDKKYQSGKGLLLTEWKVCRDPQTASKLIDDAIDQASKYLNPHLSRFEFVKLCYIVIVSEDAIEVGPSNRFDKDINFRIINIACKPQCPSKKSSKPPPLLGAFC